MSKLLCARYALTLGVALGVLASGATAQQDATQAVYEGDSQSVENAAFLGGGSNVELVQFQSGMADLGLGSTGCTHQIVAGVEYLQLRATHSQQIAYVENNTVDLANNNEFIRYHQFEFSHDPSYRLYVGCRIPECGQEFRFTYSNFSSDGDFNSVAQVGPSGSGTVDIAAPFEVVPAGDGDTLFGNASVDLDNFDLACMKTIPLGCALGCSDCGDCCDPCGDGCCDPCGCWCPAWDITWTGAVRFADISSQLNYANNIVSTTAVPSRSAYSRVDFTGVGLRGGFLGRRYFGKTGMTSVFLKADLSLLVGDLDYSAVGTDATGSNVFTPTSISCTHVIPVTEIEAGGTVALTKSMNLSAGYLFSAWHDLGHRAEYNFAATTGGQLNSFDDANILAFDGWFLRAEGAF